ncbi:MAG: OadG family transporter subunit [Bacillota bacterium]|nr:OadG family transporter subunit [Bacillota bacterium]
MPVSDAFIVLLVGMLIVMVELALLAAIIIIMSKIVRAMTKQLDKAPAPEAPASPQPAAAAAAQPYAPQALRQEQSLELYNVDEKTAAIIMAVVSDESGIPLGELSFKSIKAID